MVQSYLRDEAAALFRESGAVREHVLRRVLVIAIAVVAIWRQLCPDNEAQVAAEAAVSCEHLRRSVAIHPI